MGKEYKISPDAHGAWADNETGETINFVLEIDRATSPLNYIEAKISRYLLCLKSKGFAANQGSPYFPVVLLLTTGPVRAKSV